ncbi:hypothetical protein SAMN06265338_13413 [Rhodoblastus acidophilus]|uniref:NrS-1 polymerase-like helicase domain-containing protein n=2 Tax=Rhodoblastus acidophilus TaxID=1074 RepID=A0A212SF08_RHOAC|nr:hypothetical protein CKO16_16010 [Rhodoblastus acidophilus]RAI16721.1 hypothetical protein CH337_19885 [Rhodoblastus acidophilus]SNB84245.1 hypothetical protein SAMN06265338_13413 [Rhodoblastus acidophilus]
MSGAEEIAKTIESATVLAFPGKAAEKIADGPALVEGDGGHGRGSDDPPPPDGPDDVDGDDSDGRGGAIAQLNRTHALVLLGSRAVVMREQPDGPVEDRVRYMSPDAFKTYFQNKKVRKVSRVLDKETGEWVQKVTYVNLAPLWLASPDRRTYDGIEFFPDPRNAQGTPRYFNIWRGFGVEPSSDVPEERAKKYTVFRDHVFTNVCCGDKDLFEWTWAWLAHLIQRPRERIGTAIVLRGKMGVGKTVLGQVIGSLFPSHYFLVDDPRYLTGQFNAHMASCLLLQVDEGFWAGDKAAEGRLKGLVTADKQMIEAKGVDPIRLDNYVRLLFSSNNDWVVPAGMDERRFAVFDVGDYAKENHGYFRELYAQMDSGGREALLADLLAYDLDREGAPNVRVIPKTGALLEQKIRTLDPIPMWLYGRLIDGAQTHRKSKWEGTVPIRTLHNDYLRFAEKTGVKRKASDIEFGIALKKLLPDLTESRKRQWVEEIGADGRPTEVEKRVRCYEFPDLAACRDTFQEAMRQPIDWGPELPGEGECSADSGFRDEPL